MKDFQDLGVVIYEGSVLVNDNIPFSQRSMQIREGFSAKMRGSV